MGTDRQTSQAADSRPLSAPSVSVGVLPAAACPSLLFPPRGLSCSLSAAALVWLPPPARLLLPHLSTERRRQARRNRSLRYAGQTWQPLLLQDRDTIPSIHAPLTFNTFIFKFGSTFYLFSPCLIPLCCHRGCIVVWNGLG